MCEVPGGGMCALDAARGVMPSVEKKFSLAKMCPPPPQRDVVPFLDSVTRRHFFHYKAHEKRRGPVIWTKTYQPKHAERMSRRRKSVRLQVRVDSETQRYLLHIARQRDWSLSQVVREGIRLLMQQSGLQMTAHPVAEKEGMNNA